MKIKIKYLNDFSNSTEIPYISQSTSVHTQYSSHSYMWTFYLLKGNNSNTHEHKSIHRWKITSRGIRAFHTLLCDVAAWHEPARLLGDDGGADSLAVGNLLVGVVCLWASLHWSGSNPEICIWSYLIPDYPVCTRDTSLAVMLHHWKQKRRLLVSLKRLFL